MYNNTPIINTAYVLFKTLNTSVRLRATDFGDLSSIVAKYDYARSRYTGRQYSQASYEREEFTESAVDSPDITDIAFDPRSEITSQDQLEAHLDRYFNYDPRFAFDYEKKPRNKYSTFFNQYCMMIDERFPIDHDARSIISCFTHILRYNIGVYYLIKTFIIIAITLFFAAGSSYSYNIIDRYFETNIMNLTIWFAIYALFNMILFISISSVFNAIAGVAIRSASAVTSHTLRQREKVLLNDVYTLDVRINSDSEYDREHWPDRAQLLSILLIWFSKRLEYTTEFANLNYSRVRSQLSFMERIGNFLMFVTFLLITILVLLGSVYEYYSSAQTLIFVIFIFGMVYYSFTQNILRLYVIRRFYSELDAPSDLARPEVHRMLASHIWYRVREFVFLEERLTRFN